jgi:glycosyltransferase involved in cell wall biosynthesis
MKSWLVNDTLTCIPGTKTLWHDLLEWIPHLEDPINGYVPFQFINKFVEDKAEEEGAPDLVIRNCTFFPPLDLKSKTISILQDIYEGVNKQRQIQVANDSDLVIFNSAFTKSFYEKDITAKSVIIPLGVDFNLFKPSSNVEQGIPNNSILFIGSATDYPKGFNIVKRLVHTTNHNFCLVMKDDFEWDHPRVKVFNKVSHEKLVRIINSCSVALCTSVHETQHLAGIECLACDIPVVATNVGCYYGLESGAWGEKADTVRSFSSAIERILKNPKQYSPRSTFLSYDKEAIKDRWISAVESIL